MTTLLYWQQIYSLKWDRPHHIQHPKVASAPDLFIPYIYHEESLMVRQYTENKDIQDSKGDVDPEVEIQDEKQGHVNIKYQVL